MCIRDSHWRVTNEAIRFGVENLVECHNGVPADKAWELSSTADANLILNGLGKNSNQVLTGKVFELMRAKRPTITVTGKDSELRKIVTKCGQSPVVWDAATAQAALQSLLDEEIPPLHDAGLDYSWSRIAKKFLENLGS